MTAVDMYDKFIKNGRKVTRCTFSWKSTLQSVRSSLYRIRKQKNETFRLKTDYLTLSIHDWPEV